MECYKSELVWNGQLKKELRIVDWGQYLSIRLVNNIGAENKRQK
jgi:hypothetical protein